MEYDDMLDRAVGESSDAEAGTSRFEVPTPTVRREGSVTVVENFPSVVDRLVRDPDDVLRYLKRELGTAASVDESGRARLTGQFGRERVASVVEAYTQEYVLCPACGRPDTYLDTDGGQTRLVCEACGAHSPVGEG